MELPELLAPPEPLVLPELLVLPAPLVLPLVLPEPLVPAPLEPPVAPLSPDLRVVEDELLPSPVDDPLTLPEPVALPEPLALPEPVALPEPAALPEPSVLPAPPPPPAHPDKTRANAAATIPIGNFCTIIGLLCFVITITKGRRSRKKDLLPLRSRTTVRAGFRRLSCSSQASYLTLAQWVASHQAVNTVSGRRQEMPVRCYCGDPAASGTESRHRKARDRAAPTLGEICRKPCVLSGASCMVPRAGSLCTTRPGPPQNQTASRFAGPRKNSKIAQRSRASPRHPHRWPARSSVPDHSD